MSLLENWSTLFISSFLKQTQRTPVTVMNVNKHDGAVKLPWQSAFVCLSVCVCFQYFYFLFEFHYYSVFNDFGRSNLPVFHTFPISSIDDCLLRQMVGARLRWDRHPTENILKVCYTRWINAPLPPFCHRRIGLSEEGRLKLGTVSKQIFVFFFAFNFGIPSIHSVGW